MAASRCDDGDGGGPVEASLVTVEGAAGEVVGGQAEPVGPTGGLGLGRSMSSRSGDGTSRPELSACMIVSSSPAVDTIPPLPPLPISTVGTRSSVMSTSEPSDVAVP